MQNHGRSKLTGVEPVSYTHLDVYKRQIKYYDGAGKLVFQTHGSTVAATVIGAAPGWIPYVGWIDVYKRQELWKLISRSKPASRSNSAIRQ